jgi:hypothetical protein
LRLLFFKETTFHGKIHCLLNYGSNTFSWDLGDQDQILGTTHKVALI